MNSREILPEVRLSKSAGDVIQGAQLTHRLFDFATIFHMTIIFSASRDSLLVKFQPRALPSGPMNIPNHVNTVSRIADNCLFWRHLLL